MRSCKFKEHEEEQYEIDFPYHATISFEVHKHVKMQEEETMRHKLLLKGEEPWEKLSWN